MSCNNLGTFVIDTSPNYSLCFSAVTDIVYGTNLSGSVLYIDSGCTIPITTSYLSDGNNIFQTNGIGEVIGSTGCTCNYLGLFSSTADPQNSCGTLLTIPFYGSNLSVGSIVYTDSGCTSPSLTSYISDGIDVYDINSGQIVGISGCTCPQFFCVENDTNYDDTYQLAGTYDGQSYFTGQTNGFVMFYSTGETRWCLAQNLGDPCDQFGPYGSVSTCPDFDDSVAYYGVCVTTTTTVNPCISFDFTAVFDCYTPPDPSASPSPTPTPTPTPTPSTSSICGGASMTVTASGYTPTPTPTNTPTPTLTPDVTRDCRFSGDATFSTISEILQCANSKRFTDCFSGIHYYTTDLVLYSGSTPKQNYVYNAVINGQGYCVTYDGLFENISGVDSVLLTSEIGPSIEGSCLECFPNLSSTPTPTPTTTPTPTPSLSVCVLYKYTATNDSPSKVSITYYSCDGLETLSINPYSSVFVCSTTLPTSNSKNVSFNFLNTVC